MVDQRWLLSRRTVLGGLGVLGVSALMPRSLARAQNTPPTRLLLVHVPEGMWSGARRPTNGGTDFGPIFDALDPYRDKILVLNGLNMLSRDNGPGGDGHHRGVPHMFTCTEMQNESNAGGISIDQKIANAIGTDSPFKSLQFGVRVKYEDTNSRCIWEGAGRVLPPMEDPWYAFERVLGGITPAGPEPVTPRFDMRKSVLDHSLREVESLRNKLSAADRVNLESYQTSLRDLERRLQMTPGTVTTGCQPPDVGVEDSDLESQSKFPEFADLQASIITAAFACGQTRVASLQLGNSNDQTNYAWLGINTLGHDLAHNNGSVDDDHSKKLRVYQWYSSYFKSLLDKLSSVQEGDGTLLDNTVVVYASEFSDSNGHASNNLLWMLMGNANGYFRSGRNIDCRGRSLNDFHVSLQNAFGIADDSFGNPAYCDGALPDLT